jgi:hypothetical protein
MTRRCAKTHGLRWAGGLLLTFAAHAAFGQGLYRCNQGGGAYLSDRPCNSGAAPELKSIGPVPERQSYNREYTPSLAKAPDILPFLSPECAQMNDAVRTGPTRGLKGTAMSELISNYRLRCGEDEQLAYQKMSQARSDERNNRKAAQAVQSAEQARAKMTVEQCGEMLRIIAGKRQRLSTMTPGEQGDFERFDANYRARCKA